MSITSNRNSSKLIAWIIDLLKTLGLKETINGFLKGLPRPWQEKLTEVRVRHYLDRHSSDVPIILAVDLLKAKQRESWLYLIQEVGAENLGDYLEFGVFSGTSLSCMFHVLQELNLNHVRLFGFDSFEGMPEVAAAEDEGTWQPGQFKFGIEYTKEILTRRGIDWNRVVLTKGWFCDTLKPELIEHYQIKKASIIMVDCDLYSSTVDVLNFCAPLIQDQAVLFFDDWNSNELANKNLGEKKAFDEFLQAHPEFAVKEFGRYEAHTACFIITRHS